MRAWWAPALALALLVAGCGGKDKLSDAEMESRAKQALAGLRGDVGPAGQLSGAEVSGWVDFDTEGPFGPITVQVDVGASIAFGVHGDVRADGFMTRDKAVTFQAYCSPDRLVAVTQGLSKFGETDISLESRNLHDACAGPGSEGMLAGIGEFELIDPDILTGNLYHDRLEVVGYEQTGDDRFDATYRNEGPLGATDLVVTVKKAQVQKILASNDDSRITMQLSYGERDPLAAPQAEERLPAEVVGREDVTDDGWSWQGTLRESGPWEDYVIHVFDPDTDVSCASSGQAPVVSFALADGDDQEKEGFRMTFFEDGDGTLGPGDTIFIHHPSQSLQGWDYKVRFYDTWAGSYSTFSCSIPSPGLMPAAGVVAVCAILARRRWS